MLQHQQTQAHVGGSTWLRIEQRTMAHLTNNGQRITSETFLDADNAINRQAYMAALPGMRGEQPTPLPMPFVLPDNVRLPASYARLVATSHRICEQLTAIYDELNAVYRAYIAGPSHATVDALLAADGDMGALDGLDVMDFDTFERRVSGLDQQACALAATLRHIYTIAQGEAAKVLDELRATAEKFYEKSRKAWLAEKQAHVARITQAQAAYDAARVGGENANNYRNAAMFLTWAERLPQVATDDAMAVQGGVARYEALSVDR